MQAIFNISILNNLFHLILISIICTFLSPVDFTCMPNNELESYSNSISCTMFFGALINVYVYACIIFCLSNISFFLCSVVYTCVNM